MADTTPNDVVDSRRIHRERQHAGGVESDGRRRHLQPVPDVGEPDVRRRVHLRRDRSTADEAGTVRRPTTGDESHRHGPRHGTR